MFDGGSDMFGVDQIFLGGMIYFSGFGYCRRDPINRGWR